MIDELKQLAAKLNAAFVSNPGPTRAALSEALPQAVNSLASIAVGKDFSVRERLKAISTLLGLQARIVAEDQRRANAEIKRRQNDVAAIEARMKLVQAKSELMAESRRARAYVAKASRTIAAAKKVTSGT